MPTTTDTVSLATSTVDPFAGLPPIFRACGGEDGQFELRCPWRAGPWIYATDGRILVRMPADVLSGLTIEDGTGRKLPKLVEERIAGFLEAGYRPDPVELPDVGDGKEVCECCGHRTVESDRRIPIGGGVDLAEHFVALLRRHEAVLFLPIKPDSVMPVRFTIGEHVEGFCMPLSMAQETSGSTNG